MALCHDGCWICRSTGANRISAEKKHCLFDGGYFDVALGVSGIDQTFKDWEYQSDRNSPEDAACHAGIAQ